MVARLSPIGCNREPLRAGRRELDRPAYALRRQRHQSRPGGPFRAESSAEKAADDLNVFWPDAQLFGETVLHAVHELARLVDDQVAVAPGACRREKLHRIMMLRRRLIVSVDFDGRVRKGALGVAKGRVFVLFVDIGDGLRLPFFVPVSPMWSRNASRSEVRVSSASECTRPLRSSEIAASPFEGLGCCSAAAGPIDATDRAAPEAVAPRTERRLKFGPMMGTASERLARYLGAQPFVPAVGDHEFALGANLLIPNPRDLCRRFHRWSRANRR